MLGFWTERLNRIILMQDKFKSAFITGDLTTFNSVVFGQGIGTLQTFF